MEPSKTQESLPLHRPFAPLMAYTLQLQGDEIIYFDTASYNEKHNLMIGCPCEGSIQFYNATTFLPFEEIDTKQLDNAKMSLSYLPETETYPLGCLRGVIYAFNAAIRVVQKVQEEQVQNPVVTVAFLNSRYYAFGAFQSHRLSVGNFENEDVLDFNLKNNNVSCLYRLKKTNLLVSSQTNGSVQVYRTDRLPRLPVFDTIRGYEINDYGVSRKVQSIRISHKEYILTVGADYTIKIWHLFKGKMRKLKVIHTGDQVYCMVYLEDYKMLVTTHQTQYIKFWRFPSGKYVSKIDVKMRRCFGVFLMKSKNALGVTSISENKIKIVKLF